MSLHTAAITHTAATRTVEQPGAMTPVATEADVLVNDRGFTALAEAQTVPSLEQWLEQPGHSVALEPGDDVEQLAAALGAAQDTLQWQTLRLIVINFPHFSDGRGFSAARLLRVLGYEGELRARGELLPDQYALLRRIGFDTVQISARRAQRQPEEHWLAGQRWLQPDYQQRMRRRQQDS